MKTRNKTAFLVMISFIMLFAVVLAIPKVAVMASENEQSTNYISKVPNRQDYDGIINFVKNNYILSYNEQIYEMPELDFYAFENIAQQKFYIADISNKAFIDEKELVCMSFYPAECFHQLRGSVNFEFEGQNFFEIFLYNENDHLLDVIRTNVPTEWGEKIVDDAELLKWEDEESDELTASLVNSFRFEKQFAMSFAGAENIALSSSRISYDSYTDSDNIIHEYMDDWVEESYDGFNFLAKKYKERAMESDPIIRIIPDSFFWKSSASYFTCIGKEYGFFIQSAYYEADVFVFDIIHEKASLNSTELEVTVRPLFAASYFIKTPQSIVTLSLNKTASLNFSIKNIRLQINLANADEKNRGENGYIPENDYGAYISDYHLRVKGKTVSNTNVYRTIKTITTGLSLVPFSGSSLNLIKKSGVKAINMINDFVYENYLEQVESQYQLTYENLIKSEDGVFVYEDGVSQNDGATLINKYGSLPKSCDISLVGRNCNHSSFDNCREECLTNQNPILLKDKDDFFSAGVDFNSRSWDQDDFNYGTYAHYQLHLDICDSSGNVLNSGTGGFIDYFDRRYDCNIPIQVEEGEIYTYDIYNGTSRSFTFSPPITDRYVIEVFGDHNLVVDSDDIVLALLDGKDTRKTAVLTAGQIYQFDVLNQLVTDINGNMLSDDGYAHFIVKREKPIQLTGYDYSNHTNDYFKSDSIWYSFIPEKTDYYTIFSRANTLIELYDDQYNKLANLYLSEDMRYFAGKKYYFKVKSSSEGTYATVLLYTNTAQIYTGINVEGFDDGKKPEYIYDSMSYVYIKMFLPENTKLEIYTEKNSDTYITIFDRNYQIVDQDNDSGENQNARIQTNLKYGWYFVQVRLYDLNNPGIFQVNINVISQSDS